jgi:hypothetical protein
VLVYGATDYARGERLDVFPARFRHPEVFNRQSI